MPVAVAKDLPASPLYLDTACTRACLSDEEIDEAVRQNLREMNSTSMLKGPKAGFDLNINGDHLHMGSVCGGVLSSPMRKAAVVGAGIIGNALVKFLSATQPVEHIAVASLRESRARQACNAVATALRRDLTPTATADVSQAVCDADVVCTSTGVSRDTDVVRAEWLKNDSVVCTLGTRREVDLKLLSDAWIVVDDADGIRLRRSDFREGGACWNRIVGDIGSVTSGRLPPPPDDKKINVVLIGMGRLDVAPDARAIANARRKGLGIQLERQ